MPPQKILVTGGCGFIGHHFIEHLLKNTDWQITVLDRLTYASNGFDRLRDIEAFDDKRVRIFTHDISQRPTHEFMKELGQFDYIVHMGAETHVDRSIENAEPFVISNMLGTMRMLDIACDQKELKAFVYFSTDEVFGPAPQGTAYNEWDRYNSGNPYAATKAGGEELALAYANTFKIPVIITHTMNVFGERQHPEKFIPLVIKKVLAGEEIEIHSDPTKTIPGSRMWIHARNVAAAILFLLGHDLPSKANAVGIHADKFNIVGEREVNNLVMAQQIAAILGKELKYRMVDFHGFRPGHDLRYALGGSKMRDMGWILPMTFEDSLRKTVEWMIRNKRWLEG